MTDDQLAALNQWLRQCRGVCFVARDETTLWEAAYRAAGVDCTLSAFQWHCRRIGLSPEAHGGGVRLDFNGAPALLEAADHLHSG